MNQTPEVALPDGLRARKQRQTRERIGQAALRLFLDNGFESTTLDAIAEAAQISRRTFFHYFETKEAVLQSVEYGVDAAFRDALAAAPADLSPLNAVHCALSVVVSRYETKEAVAIDKLMRSTDALRARLQANYERQEQALFAALCERWPAPERRSALGLVAMAGVGVMRIAADVWRSDGAPRPLAGYLDEAFENLRCEFDLK